MVSPSDNQGSREQAALVVMTNSGMASIVEGLLERKGLEVGVVSTLSEARRKVAARPLLLVVVDLGVFGHAGLGFTRWLRRQTNQPFIHVIALTPIGDSAMVDAGLKAGADNYVTTPIRSQHFEACLEVVLKQASVELRLLRQKALVEQLEFIEAEIQRNTAEWEALNTDDLAAVPTGGPGSTEDLARGSGVEGSALLLSDTAQQAGRDWVLFRAIEAGLSRCIEHQKPLAVLMLEAQALDPIEEGDVETFLEVLTTRVRTALLGRQTLQRLQGYVSCIVLPETAEAEAIWMAQRILAAVQKDVISSARGQHKASLKIGIATLDPNYARSPFDILDWAQLALDRAKAGSSSGWWVHHHQRERQQ